MIRTFMAALIAVVLVVGCEKRAAQEEHSAQPTTAPTLAEMKNATYSGIGEVGGAVTLVNGDWEGEPFEQGAASRPHAYYARDFRVTGDMDGDGNEEALALLGYNAGGSGELVYIAVMRKENGSADCVATALVGDRVKIRDARIDGGHVILDVLQAGEGDAMCCPGELATRVWQLTPDGFVEVRTTPAGRLSLSALSGVEWVLRWWQWNEAAPGPEATAVFYDNRVAGSTGCNRYLATVIEGDSPGSVSVTAPTTTLEVCPDPAGSTEKRFLGLLAAVKQYSFVTGLLSLEYEYEGAHGALLFERRTLSDSSPLE